MHWLYLGIHKHFAGKYHFRRKLILRVDGIKKKIIEKSFILA